MASRWGLGPVFIYEWLVMSRRWQVYAARSAFVGLLLCGLVFVWVSRDQSQSIRAMSAVGEGFYFAIVGMQIALVMLAAPAATAGSICSDKASGKLTHLLVTDLSAAEIVLGKLAARLVPVLGLVACALPVLALGTLMGGIDPVALAGAFLVTIGLAVLGCALALTFSVWASKAHEVLLATYAVWVLWLLAEPIWSTLRSYWSSSWVWMALGWVPIEWFSNSNPFSLAFGPYMRPGSVTLWHHSGFLLGALLISMVLIAISIRRIRAVNARQAGQVAGRSRKGTIARPSRWNRWWPSPSLDFNPVLWREWHRRRPSGWILAVGGIYTILAVTFTTLGIIQMLSVRPGAGMVGPAAISALITNGFLVSLGLLMLGILSATALAEERARGSLDVLLATPLSTSTVVLGKWLGVFRTVPLIALMPALITSACSLRLCESQRWPLAPLAILLVFAYGAAVTSLGLALATWIPRLGRVVGACVGIIVLVTVGMFFGPILFVNGGSGISREVAQGIFMASPFPGSIVPQISMLESYEDWRYTLVWLILWILVYFGAAILFLLATLASFDRCLGRVGGPLEWRLPRKGD